MITITDNSDSKTVYNITAELKKIIEKIQCDTKKDYTYIVLEQFSDKFKAKEVSHNQLIKEQWKTINEKNEEITELKAELIFVKELNQKLNQASDNFELIVELKELVQKYEGGTYGQDN